MGKRYYCEYCDKSFADNPTGRKTHLTGVYHLRNKKAHYDSMRDSKEILADDASKRQCKSFFSSGECRFGDRCQFSHLTPEVKAALLDSVHQKEEAKRQKAEALAAVDFRAKLTAWAEERKERLEKEKEKPDTAKLDKIPGFPDYQLSETLKVLPNLPPSVLPPTHDSFLTADFPEWG